MYRIKPNGNYNFVIADIKVSLNSTQLDGILVEKELFDSSLEAKKLVEAKMLLVEDVKDVKKSISTKPNKKENKEKVFVVQGEVNKAPEDVFIKNDQQVKEVKSVVEVEAVTKELKKDDSKKAEIKKEAEVPVEKEVVKAEPKASTKEKKNQVEKPATNKAKEIKK